MKATLVTLVTATSIIAWADIGAQQVLDARIDTVLVAAAAYLTQYEREVTAIVAEEHYLQEAGRQKRRLRSDLLILRDGEQGWIEFRDVYEVDGRPIRDREQRLVALFQKPGPNPLDQAVRISAEGARHNLNPRIGRVKRTVNTPLVALHFLRARNQSRSTFTVNSARSVASGGDVVVEFAEHATPRLIHTPEGTAARGAFSIDLYSGRVTSSEVTVAAPSATSLIHVTYAPDPRLKIWLPHTMAERYHLGRGETITGHAEYSNFRQFRVDTSMEIGEGRPKRRSRPDGER